MQRVLKVFTGRGGELEGNADGDAAAEDNDNNVDDEGDGNSCPPLTPFYTPGSFTCLTHYIQQQPNPVGSSLNPLLQMKCYFV